MSHYINGTTSLASGVTSVVVALPVGTFIAPPTLVLVGVENITNDSPKYLIDATVSAKSETAFSVELSAAPNTDNYRLIWFAGGPDAVFSTPSGRKVSELTEFSGSVDTVRFLLGIAQPDVYSSEETMRIPVDTLKNLSGEWVAVPTGFNAPGELGDKAYNASHFFIHNGTQWLRIAHSGLLW